MTQLDVVAKIRQERDDNHVLDEDLTPMRLARRRLMHGETIDVMSFCATYGCSTSVPYDVEAQLRAIGYDVERIPLPREPGQRGSPKQTLRVTNPEHDPTDEQIREITVWRRSKDAKSKKRSRSKTKAVEVASEPDQNGLVPPLPGIAQHVVVYALMVDKKGAVTIGLRDTRSSRSWLTTLVGTSAS